MKSAVLCAAPCVSCADIDRPRSPSKPEFCGRCWWALPLPTRVAYESGRADIKRVVRASQDSQKSVREFGGGKQHGMGEGK